MHSKGKGQLPEQNLLTRRYAVCSVNRPIVNNVETLANVPGIINNGADWFKGLSLTDEGGTKLYGVSGRVKKPGLWELPLGTTMREIIEEHAGGMKDGYKFKGALPGGASTDFLIEEHLDVKMDYSNVSEVWQQTWDRNDHNS